MRVKDLIQQLQAYSPDTELAVAYWDKETVEGIVNHETQPVTDELWSEIVYRYEDGEWGWQSWAADTFVDIFEEALDNDEQA